MEELAKKMREIEEDASLTFEEKAQRIRALQLEFLQQRAIGWITPGCCGDRL